MATFDKRKNGWRVWICVKGIRDSATRNTKAEAKEWAATRTIEILLNKAGKVGHSKPLGDAFKRYLEEVTPTKRGKRQEKIRLERFQKDPLASIRLSDIVPEDFAKWRDARLKQVSGATVRRELNQMSSVLTMAKMEWRWIQSNPISDIKRPPHSKSRDRRISDDEIANVLDAVGFVEGKEPKTITQLIGYYFLTAIETAMRLGELCALPSEDIHLGDRYADLSNTKNGDQRDVPLSSRAVELMAVIKKSPLRANSNSCTSLFRKALESTNIVDLHFHDTRHEALTRLARKLDVLDLAKMAGHRDTKSLMIYYNPTPGEIAARLG